MINKLECKNVSISYAKQLILKNINFEIETRQIISIVGSSGGGKSTLLKAIAGFIPYQGKIFLNRQIVTKSDATRGVVFQDASLFPWLDVEQNIAFGLKATHQSKIEINQRVTELLHTVEMEKYRKNRISTLSGGMKQRIAIARALANKPPFLLMDEPFGALDSITRDKMQNLILKIAQNQNIGILLITHDLDEAIRCGNYILVLDKKHQTFQKIDNPLFNKNISTENLALLNQVKESLIASF